MTAERFENTKGDAVALLAFSAVLTAICVWGAQPSWTWCLGPFCTGLAAIAWGPDRLWVDIAAGTLRTERRMLGLPYGRRQRLAQGSVVALRLTDEEDGVRQLAELRFTDGECWELPLGVHREIDRLARALEAATRGPVPIERRPWRRSAG